MRSLVVLLALLVAGCLAQSPAPAHEAPADTSLPATTAAFPKVDAAATLADLKTFSEAYPYRQSGDPMHLMARDWLANTLKAAGLEVVRQKFPSTGPAGAYDGENIIGIKWGTDRTHWIVVGGHYDITEGAVFGTYDDGSGTLMTVKLAQAFANLATDRTLAFIPFDQEEKGLVGAKYFVKSIQDGSFVYPVTVDAMIDLDMVGITHPHPAKLVAWQNSPELRAFITNRTTELGFPAGHMEFRKPKGGSSDGAAFIAANIPTAYFWSDWDEVVLKDGTVVQGQSYPWWHRADTYETMLAMAGDEATLRAGFQNVLDLVSPLLVRLADSGMQPDTDA